MKQKTVFLGSLRQFLILLLILTFMVNIQLRGKEVNKNISNLGLKIDKVLYHPVTVIAELPFLLYTYDNLKQNGEKLTGFNNEPRWDHHLWLGEILWKTGAIIYYLWPDMYNNLEPEIKFLFRMSPIIVADDMIEHNVLQPKDGYHGPQDGTSKIKHGLFYNLYVAVYNSKIPIRTNFIAINAYKELDIIGGLDWNDGGLYFGFREKNFFYYDISFIFFVVPGSEIVEDACSDIKTKAGNFIKKFFVGAEYQIPISKKYGISFAITAGQGFYPKHFKGIMPKEIIPKLQASCGINFFENFKQ